MNKTGNLGLRFITALIGAALVIGGVWWSSYTFMIVFLIVLSVSVVEFLRLKKVTDPVIRWGVISSTILSFLVTFLSCNYAGYETSLYLIPVWVFGSLIPVVYRKTEDPGGMTAAVFMSHAYLTLPYLLVLLLAFAFGEYGGYLIIGYLLMIWGLDSGAYFAGTAFGSHKLFERLSPNKTWEGFLGGVILSMVGGWISFQLFGTLTLVEWLIFSLIVSVFGTLGDLFESLIKRSSALKDSGSSLPGHGGFLDRFDSLVFSIPFVLVYIKIFIIS